MDYEAYPRTMGEDRILSKGDHLVIHSKVDMHEWDVGQTRKTVIYINGGYWYLVGKQFSTTEGVIYLLEPWPNVMREIPARIIEYDEEYVRARDRTVGKMRLYGRIGVVLYLMRALIGFLPSGIKTKIEMKFGLSARYATTASIFAELLLFLGSAGFFIVMPAFAADRAPGANDPLYVLDVLIGSFVFEILLMLLLLIDVAIRYSSCLREDSSPFGVLEWVWAWKRNC
jgi:hypothetical protein